jgi:hypothetical protein
MRAVSDLSSHIRSEYLATYDPATARDLTEAYDAAIDWKVIMAKSRMARPLWQRHQARSSSGCHSWIDVLSLLRNCPSVS